MNVETAISEYAWADDGIVKYAKQLKAAEMALHNAGYNNESIERMCDELRKS